MRTLALIAVFGAQLLVSGTAAAAPEDRTVVLSVSRTWAPYLFIDDDTGARSGVVLDVLAEITERIGYRLEVELLPSKRSTRYLEQGRIDAKLKAMEWVDDAGSYTWTSPIVGMSDVLVYRSAAPLVYREPADLHGKTIGTRIGWSYPVLEPLFEAGSAVREDASNDKAMLDMLLKGRSDVVTMNMHVLQWLQTSNQRYRDELTFAPEPLEDVGLRMYFTTRHDWQPFVAAFDRELEAMRQDGRLRAIIDRYLAM